MEDLGSDYHDPGWFSVIRTFFPFPSLPVSPLSSIIGSLRSDDGDGNENNFVRASRFFVHFFAVVARLQGESAQFHVLGRTGTQDNYFLFLFLNVDSVL